MKKLSRGDSFETLSDLRAALASKNAKQLAIPLPVFAELGGSYFVTQSDIHGIELPIDPEWATNYKKLEKTYSYRSVQTSSFRDGNRYFLQIKLLDPSFLQPFAWFVDGLIDDMPSRVDQVTPMAIRHLVQWQELFKSPPRLTPPIELQAGLLFELLTLERLTTTFGPGVLDKWLGPENERHDFELPDVSLECKATLKRNALIVKINGQYQLECLGDKPLHLLVQQLERDPDGPLSIPILVERLVRESHVNRDQLLLKLAKLDIHYSLLNDPLQFQNFRKRDSFAFVVEPGFPRIHSESLHRRINGIEYDIDLSDPEQVPGYYTQSAFLEN